jgi:hypothetical protein
MWPRVLAQLVELLPHLARVLPMADKYFSSKAKTEKATEAAMAAMAEGMRGDLGQVAKAHAGLYQQLQEQSAQLAEMRNDVKGLRTAMESMIALETRVTALGRWVKAGVWLVIALLVLVIVLLVRGR